MLHDRASVVDLLVQGAALSETRLGDFLSRCTSGPCPERKALLRCYDLGKPDEDSAQLLERCRSDDRAAWDELIARVREQLLHELHIHNLIERCNAGDENASVELVRSIEGGIKGMLAFHCYKLKEPDVDDLSQTILAKLFKALPDYDWRKSGFASFWRLLANQVIVDHIRRITTQSRGSGVEALSLEAAAEEERPIEIASPEPGPDAEANRGDEFQMLYQALEKLGPADSRCRQMFHLFYYEELTYEEIAGELKINAKTVSVSLVRCREKAREFFPKKFR